MITITFNAFSFLQKKLSRHNIPFSNVTLEIPQNTTVTQLISRLKLLREDVEGVFVNGSVVPFDTVIQDGDRVGFVPPGTPGPYRVLLGIVKKKNEYS
ncbi:ThiamineS protein [Desulfamplus magnetovallimortis]|uniref:ThiamineS protein n=1 Tax=Desulfamplus magnetovallimortis TaxID=1246637 RepID=A0A1W1HIB5_9BACT|nr:MoaD/ThiS family protein [Desulfamplus magnetovallimortis]SLM32214.1 ThiamineS protein [Desulfamplus magnetovallimortis]